MKIATPGTRALRLRTVPLFVAYLFVLQSLAVGLVSPVAALRAGGFASGACIQSSDERGPGIPGAPRPSGGQSHEQCCVFHGAGAGMAPPEMAAKLPPAPHGIPADWLAATLTGVSLWPTLPVGSRAPPAFDL
ncbi:MAG: hypothetical protein WAK01_04165 [Methylocystis sp.]